MVECARNLLRSAGARVLLQASGERVVARADPAPFRLGCNLEKVRPPASVGKRCQGPTSISGPPPRFVTQAAAPIGALALDRRVCGRTTGARALVEVGISRLLPRATNAGGPATARKRANRCWARGSPRSPGPRRAASVGITILTAGVERKRTGDYDVGLTALTALIYKYYHVLGPQVQNHIINNLLNKRGPFDPADQICRPYAPPPVPETENHVMNDRDGAVSDEPVALDRRRGRPPNMTTREMGWTSGC